MKKSILSLLLVVSLLSSLLCVPAMAAENATLNVTGAESGVKSGDTITATVNVPAVQQIASGFVKLLFDKSKLEAKSINAPSTFSSYPTTVSSLAAANNNGFVSISIGNGAITLFDMEGPLTITVAFSVKSTAATGSATDIIKIDVADGYYFEDLDANTVTAPTFLNSTFSTNILKAPISNVSAITAKVDAPAKGTALDTSVDLGGATAYIGAVEWYKGNTATGTVVTGSADANTVYTAKITLTARTGESFANSLNDKTTGDGYKIKFVDASKLELTKTFDATADKDAASITTAPTAKTLTYTGSAQELVTAGSGVTGGTLKYRLGESGAWSTDIPKATDAGTYTVYYMVKGDTDHSDFTPSPNTVSVTIGQKNISSVTIDPIPNETYDGNAKTPTPVVKDGTTLTDADYTVGYSNNTNAGTATVTITGKGNYTNTKTANFTINHKNVTANKGTQNQNVVLNVGDFTKPVIDSAITGSLTYSYDGANTYEAVKTKLAALSVGATGDIDYTFTANGNYTGTITGKIHFTIVDLPAATVTTAPVAKTGLVYSGTEQVLITAGTANGGTMQYSLNGTDWSTAIPKAKDAKNYTVYYKVVGDSSHSDSVVKSVTVTIGKKPATVAPKSYTITKGSAIPTFELVYTGLVAGDTLTPSAGTAPTFSCFEADGTTPVSTSTAAGSYTITWTNKDTTTFTGVDNYNLTKTATATLTISNPSSSGGGGGGSSTPSYTVSVDKTENGTITVSPKSASKGSIVTITVKPDKGYTLETLRALDMSGYAMELTENNGRFTFKMPASAVIVKATFMDDNTMLNFFVDVKASDYFYDAVLWAAEKGVTSGADALHFNPNAPCTRAQIVTFLWRAAGSPAPKNMSSFADVPADAFYAKAVAWAVENGITGGTGDSKFSPDATCTRAQSVTFLYRAAGSPKVSGSAEFGDVATNAYYADAVAWAAKNGITGGIGGGLFGSNNDCTRAQIVTFLYRSVK